MRHPLHPALVHFPIACWSLATLADLASLAWVGPTVRLGGLLIAAGLVTALAAMVAGLVEWMKIGDDHPALRIANRHMYWVAASWTLYAASLFLRRQDGTLLGAPGAVAIALSVAGFAALCGAGWLGARLVYEYAVGVRTPTGRS